MLKDTFFSIKETVDIENDLICHIAFRDSHPIFQSHFAGNPITGNAPLGELDIEGRAVSLAKIIRDVKDDKTTLQLQEEFFKKSQAPLNTKAR
jgi:hypothetical protein